METTETGGSATQDRAKDAGAATGSSGHAALLRRIRRFVRAASSSSTPETFDELARAAFAYQARHIAPVGALAASRGVGCEAGPEAVRTWRDVPAVPALAYKSLDLLPDDVDREAATTFRSSGTSRRTAQAEATAGRSVHRHPFPDLYRETIDAGFPGPCLPRGPRLGQAGAAGRVPILSLIPTRADAPDSSLSFMAEHVIARWGTEESATVLAADGLDADGAAAWVRARADEPERPVLVLATGLALAALIETFEALAATAPSLALPPGSVVFETGGSKGRTRALGRTELLAGIERCLGVPERRVVREYGMTELTSQLYTRVLDGGDPNLFVPPPWMRAWVLDPETLKEAPAGSVGLVALFDLANLGSAVHLLTEDLGSIEDGGLRLAGRARGAELRGCSLTAEEMTAPR